MARDGSGTYTLAATMATASQVASSATVNSIMNDIAQALTDSINKDGSKAFAAAQSMGGNRLTSLGAATALTDAAQFSQVQKGTVSQATTVGGTVDVITLAMTPTMTSLTSGMVVRWVSGGANTVTTPTINIDSLGAKTVKKNPGGAALAAGDLGASGTVHFAQYNGTDFILLNPVLDVSGYATSASVTSAIAAATLGQQTLIINAADMTPRTTNGASLGTLEMGTNDNMIKYLAFDATTSEGACFGMMMPKGWNEGTLVCQFVWTHPATTTNFGVVWGIRAIAYANDDALDSAYGTAVEVNDTGGTTHDVYISPESGELTVAGSPGDEEFVIFEIYRDPAEAADTMAVDAWLLSVKVHYTISAAIDT